MENKQNNSISGVKLNDEKTNNVIKIMSTSTTNLQADDLDQEMIEIEKAFNGINLKNFDIKAEPNIEETENCKIKNINTESNVKSKDSANLNDNICWVNKIKKSLTKSLPKIINEIIKEEVNIRSNECIENNPSKSYNRFKWIRGESQKILPIGKTYNNSLKYNQNQNFHQNKHYHHNEKQNRNKERGNYRTEHENPIRKAKNVTLPYNKNFNNSKGFSKNERNRNEIVIEKNNVNKNGVKIHNETVVQNKHEYNTKNYSNKYNWNRRNNEQNSKIINNNRNISKNNQNKGNTSTRYDSDNGGNVKRIQKSRGSTVKYNSDNGSVKRLQRSRGSTVKYNSDNGSVKRLQRSRGSTVKYDSDNGSVKILQSHEDSTVKTRKQIKVIKTKLFKEAFKIIQGDAN